MTPLQAKRLGWIKSYKSEHGNAPTFREMCSGFGVRSLRTVSDTIAALERKGEVERVRGKARGVRPKSED